MSYIRRLVDYGPPRDVPCAPFPLPPAPPSAPVKGQPAAFAPPDVHALYRAGLVAPWNEDIRRALPTGAAPCGDAARNSGADAPLAQRLADDWRTELRLRHDLASTRAPDTLGGGVQDRVSAALAHPYRFDPDYHLDSTPEWTERIARFEDRARLGYRPAPVGQTRFAEAGVRGYGQEMPTGLS